MVFCFQERVTYLFLAILLVLISIKSFTSISIDEATSYIVFFKNSYLNIYLNHPSDANNHILYSFITKTLMSFFGEHRFVLRLCSFISFIVYFLFIYKISTILKINKALLFSLAILNPFVFEFFSLARGYSLALAFQTIAIYFFIKDKSSNFLHINLFLMSFANFSFLTFHFAIYVYLYISNISKKLLVFSFFNVCIFSYPLFRLVKDERLYFGGTDNFFNDVVNSLTSYSFHHFLPLLEETFFYLTVILIILIVYHSYKLESLNIIFLISVLIPIILFNLFNVKYPIQRTAFFYIPIFSICLSRLIKNHALANFISLILCFNFLFSYDPKVFTAFPESSYNESVIKDILNDKKSNKITLYTEGLNINPFRYCKKSQKLKGLRIKEFKYNFDKEGFYYVNTSNIKNHNELIKISSYSDWSLVKKIL